MAIRPIFDDVRSRLSIDDVRLPAICEVVSSTVVSESNIVDRLEGDWSADTAVELTDFNELFTLDELVSKQQTHPLLVESANPNNQEIELNRMSTKTLYPLRPEHGLLDNVHGGDITILYHYMVDRESRMSQRNPLIKVPFRVWCRFETFILRTEYERRMRRKSALTLHSIVRTWLILNTRPEYPSFFLQGFLPRKPTLSSVAMYYLFMGLWFCRWPLSIIYYILFFPFICLVVLRHQIILVDEEVLQRQMLDGISMLGTKHWKDTHLRNRLRLLDEMEMGQSNFELGSVSGEYINAVGTMPALPQARVRLGRE